MSTTAQQIFDLLPKPGTPERKHVFVELLREWVAEHGSGPVKVEGESSDRSVYVFEFPLTTGNSPPKLNPEREAEVLRRCADLDNSFDLDDYIKEL